MKQFKALLLLSTLMLLSCYMIYAQSDITEDSRSGVLGNWGITELEKHQPVQKNDLNIPKDLLNRYIESKRNNNESEKIRLGELIQSYLDPGPNSVLDQVRGQNEFRAVFSTNFNNPPYQTDWYTNDVQAYNGTVGTYAGSFRRLDLKQGEDGWMYLCVSRTGISGTLDGITVFMSSNNGATWPISQTLVFSSWKLFTLSMLVENRSLSNSNPDSTRFLVYFTTAPASSGNDAQLWVWSSRRNGTSQFNKAVGIPAAGNKYEFVSACSDGTYSTTGTFMHIVVREATNAGAQVGLRHFYTTNWSLTHTSSLINTGYNDYYPSVQYGEKNGNDSIYIAIERRFSATDYDIRVIATPEVPGTATHTYYITSGTNIKYEKPCLTVVQQHYSVPKKMLVTCTRNNIAKYHSSSDGGTSWVTDLNLTSVGLRDYTWCSSDSNTTSGGYIIACTVDQNGDSITVRRGIPGSLGATIYKRNSLMSTGLIAPVCEVINISGSLKSSIAYAGQGPINVYYNAEQLITGIEPINNTAPDFYSLNQNYPNPFNPVTNINFGISKAGFVKLVVYDVLGKQVTELVNGNYNAGSYSVSFNAATLSSGTYFYRIESEGFTDVKKMILIK